MEFVDYNTAKLIVKVLGTFPILAAKLLYRKNLVSG